VDEDDRNDTTEHKHATVGHSDNLHINQLRFVFCVCLV
jgi:hypothetical protein